MNFAENAKLQYENRLRQARGGDLAFREKAWAEFQRQGLPEKNNEAWKYSSLAALSKSVWNEAESSDQIPPSALRIIKENRGAFDIAVVINGVFHKKSSQLTLESGYEFSARLNADAAPEMSFDDGFISLATAVNRGGYDLRVAPGIRFPKPLLIIHCTQGEGSWSPTFNRISLGAKSEIQLAEVFVGGANAYLCTDITKADLADGAILSWARLQQDSAKASHFSEVQAQLQASAQLFLSQVNGGSAWARHSLKVDIRGERAGAHIHGLSFGRDHQHMDQRVQVSHWAANSSSSQMFKGVLKDFARGILNGKIYIARDAQKVNSSQLNHHLLLSSLAEAITKPELEIYADDVKANHGASVGKMDEDKLFYLMSRAIPRRQAVQMLARAFVGDVLMKIPAAPLREFLASEVESLLPEFLAQMETLK